MSEEGGRSRQCCSLPEVPEREFKPDVDERRTRLIQTLGTKWVNGTVLTYAFFDSSPSMVETKQAEDKLSEEKEEEKTEEKSESKFDGSWSGPESQKDAMRKAFDVWRSVGIGIDFKEISEVTSADIRIGFERGAGSWSYMGRDILNKNWIKENERTMNIGWDISRDIDTAIHEIGHTLGFPHEHQNPNAGIVWNEDAVYADLAAPPNMWDKEKTYHNIIRKITPDQVQGSTWDPDSIMHYPFKAGLITQPEKYQKESLEPSPGLSERDKQWVKKLYPPPPPTFPKLILNQPYDLVIDEGGVVTLSVVPDLAGRYEIKTVGFSDTTLVLFERPADEDDPPKKIAADDDSGEEQNAKLEVQLQKGKKYLLQVRLMWVKNKGSMLAVLMKQLPQKDPDGNDDEKKVCCNIL